MSYNNFQIQEYRWQSGTTPVTNLALTGNQTFLSVQPGSIPFQINGQVLSVDWKSNSVGSLYIVTSGTAFEIWRRNAPSGTNWQHSTPGEFNQVTTGSIAGAYLAQFTINEPLILTVSGAALNDVAQVVIRYR